MLAAGLSALLLMATAIAVDVDVYHHFENHDFFSMRMMGDDGAFRWNTYSAVQEFAMDAGGEVLISGVSASHPISFSLYTYEQWDVYRSLVFQITSMAAYDETMALTCMYPAAARIPFDPRRTKNASAMSIRIPITVASQYTLQIESCMPAYNLVQAKVVMRNVAYDGRVTEHLGVDQLGLLPVYMIMTAAFVLMTTLWGIDCLRKERPTYAIHGVFGLCLVVRTFECMIKLWHYRVLSKSGRTRSYLSVGKDMCEHMTTTVLLLFLLLSSLGWSMRRRYLTQSERRIVQACFVLYVFVAMTKATCDSRNQVCQGYMLTEYVLKSLMLLGIIITLNYSIAQLQTKLENEYGRWTESKIPKMQVRLNLYLSLRYSFLAYLLLPTAVLMINLTVINPPGTWRYVWATYVFEEVVMACIFTHLGLVLRPVHPMTLDLLTQKKAT
ncbi:hypothetical protein SPRG_01490 [Saprolegnia parasitica CBS 223.65]|uniref:GOST seven transmembrane domain-containing protein n=1 Tax=Saprolegnia parasitica (strain CBS 223.65) TaxID=695850 RepID=A0A067CUH6_SAPPC|nr:hypothetical protein SPRG_01490 [Saprolegnia parasitica CBS 223.65]KDO34354.1 hypothetical protein SPRG_01490 [Saprolegnia parasitica CBS 223.65]|eukprot:XP_012195090.1 hypothetical protein SPRG_01490 [Saprolegnia parasitica CBS 223.65]